MSAPDKDNDVDSSSVADPFVSPERFAVRYTFDCIGKATARLLNATGCVRLCYCVFVRTTLDIADEAYYIAKAIARDQNRSLGRVVGDLILQTAKGSKGASITMSDYGFPTFRCSQLVATEDVKAFDDEE